MKIDRPLIECLTRLRNMPEFQPLRDHLEGRMRQHLEALVGLNEDRPLHIAQGMAREAKYFIELIEQSATLVDKGRQ